MKLGGKGGCAPAASHNFVSGHHAGECYEKRNADASGITHCVIDASGSPSHDLAVLTKRELLARVEDRAASRAEIARVLSIAPARVTEMYADKRDLSFDEARRLISHYGLEGEASAPRPASIEDIAADNGIALVEEIDLSLGMGGGRFADLAESRGMVPFKDEWLRGLYAGPLSALRVVRGEGDSMQPTILDGDLVLVDTSQQSIRAQDRIWAVFWGDLGMIKRVRRTPNGSYQLMSDNPSIAAIEAVDGEMHVMGRVIWIGRRM